MPGPSESVASSLGAPCRGGNTPVSIESWYHSRANSAANGSSLSAAPQAVEAVGWKPKLKGLFQQSDRNVGLAGRSEWIGPSPHANHQSPSTVQKRSPISALKLTRSGRRARGSFLQNLNVGFRLPNVRTLKRSSPVQVRNTSKSNENNKSNARPNITGQRVARRDEGNQQKAFRPSEDAIFAVETEQRVEPGQWRDPRTGAIALDCDRTHRTCGATPPPQGCHRQATQEGMACGAPNRQGPALFCRVRFTGSSGARSRLRLQGRVELQTRKFGPQKDHKSPQKRGQNRSKTLKESGLRSPGENRLQNKKNQP